MAISALGGCCIPLKTSRPQEKFTLVRRAQEPFPQTAAGVMRGRVEGHECFDKGNGIKGLNHYRCCFFLYIKRIKG